jgi:tRNA pseudouridine38-40 synthase
MTTDLPFGVLIWVAYEGKHFHGMARQRGLRTVMSELEQAIGRIDPVASEVRCVSRTDAGVNAEQQAVAFDTAKSISPRGWVLALSQHLDYDVAVVAAATVPAGFDPRRLVISKTYTYRIFQSRVRSPFLEHRAWRVCERLNHAVMIAEAEALVGPHDFAAFRSIHDKRTNTQRNLMHVSLEPDPCHERAISLKIQGDRFLMHMVRIIVGTIVDVGRGRLAPGACRRALTSCDRRDLGMTAPPFGLCLSRVVLEQTGADRWPQVDETPVVT